MKSIGFLAASPQPLILAKGFKPNSFNFASETKINAAAPSLILEAFGPVTVPFSFWKTALADLSLASLNFSISSSFSTTTSGLPLTPLIVTGAISWLNLPCFNALPAFDMI